MSTPRNAGAKKATSPQAVVEGTPYKRDPHDPIAELHRELLGGVDLSAIYRPAPNDCVPGDLIQATWENATTVDEAGNQLWNVALGNIRLSMIAGMRLGSEYALANRAHGSHTASGIGGVKKVDRLEGGLLVGFTVGGDPAPIMGEDTVNIFQMTRDLTLWCVAPKMKKGEVGRAVQFGAGQTYALGVQTLAPVNGKARSQALWLAKCADFCAEDALAKLDAIQRQLMAQAGTVAEVAEPTEVHTA